MEGLHSRRGLVALFFGAATSVCRFWFDRSLVGEKRAGCPLLSGVATSVCLFSFSGGHFGEELLVSLLFYMAPSLSPFWCGERRELVVVHSYVDSNVLPFWCVASLLKKRERVDWLDLRCGFLV